MILGTISRYMNPICECFFFFILEKYAKSVDPKNGKVLIEKWQFFKSDSEIVGLIQL